MNWFSSIPNYLQALIAGVFTWIITSLGATIVYIFKKINKNTMDIMLSVSAGIMLSASYFSLLSPAIDMANNLDLIPYLYISTGFLFGGLLLFFGDKVFTYKFKNTKKHKRSIMVILSITLHNIPEGMAIGVAFGSIKYGLDGVTLASAIMLAIGIGIQNFPEGSAVSLPLRRDGMSRNKAFLFGLLSGAVEPISSLFGAIAVMKVRFLLPILLSFAAGAMIYVAVCELIPESQTNKRKDLMSLFTIIGFIIMMIFDILFA